MIVAGGAGTRLWPLTATTPKPLLPCCGEPFLLGQLRRLAASGVRRVLLVVGAQTAPFAVLQAPGAALGVEVVLVPEPEPLDTAGGVRSALDQVSGAFFVLNGDVLSAVDLGQVVAAHQAARAAATLVLTRVADTSTFGVCVREGSRIVAFVEKPPPGSLPDHDTVNAGTYLLEPDALEGFTPGRLSFEREVFPGLLAAGARLEGVVDEGAWADLGTPTRFRAGHRLVLDGRLRWPSLELVAPDAAGVRCHPEAQVAPGARLVGPLLLSSGSTIEPGARLGPHVVVGAGTRVGAGAELRDTVLGDHVEVAAGARLSGAIVAAGAHIGPGAVLAGDTVVAEGAVVPPGALLGPGTRWTATSAASSCT